METLRSMKCIKSHFVYKLKLGKDNTPIRYKARLVAKGFQQCWGVDYVDSFSATAHPTAIRAIFALAAQKGWFTNNTDIQLAFVNTLLEELVYVQPLGGVEEGESKGKVYQLNVSLYSLVQS